MKEGIKRLLSLGLIIILLMKGLSSLLPAFSDSLKDNLLTELQAEPEQEKQKNGNSKVVETELIEDIFEKPHFCYADLSPYIIASRCIADREHSLPTVHLDISTPPPDALQAG